MYTYNVQIQSAVRTLSKRNRLHRIGSRLIYMIQNGFSSKVVVTLSFCRINEKKYKVKMYNSWFSSYFSIKSCEQCMYKKNDILFI